MNVGSVARSSHLDVTPVAPAPASATPPVDLTRDVAETTPASTARMTGPEAARAEVPRSSVFVDPQIRRAAEAFARGGLGGLDTWMQQHPADARWLLSVPRAQLVQGLQEALATRYGGYLGPVHAFTDARAIDAHLADTVQPQVREAVRLTTVGRIDAMTRALTASSPEQIVSALRAAPADSRLAAVGSALELRGDAADVERVEAWRRRALDELGALRDRVMGQAWMPEELPGSMAHVQRVMGLERATPESIAGQAFFRGGHTAEARVHEAQSIVEGVMTFAEVAELALETAHVAAAVAAEGGGMAAQFVGIAAAPGLAGAGGALAFGIGTMVFGVLLHHAVEQNRADRTRAAGALGL